MHISKASGLPDNAYRELTPGEVYEPIVAAEKSVAEITARSVIMGVIMAVIFSGACAFLGLKIGQVFEAAIPIAILSVGLSPLFAAVSGRKSTILENVIIQSIGAASGVVVAGAIFTIPAIYILGLKVSFFKILTASFLGGALGILFTILFRKYFVAEMHGQFPFPEATATTEVLVVGEEGGNQAKVLVISMLLAACYDFCVYTFKWFSEVFSTQVFPWGKTLVLKTKLVFEMNVTAAIVGLGYIIGLRYAAIICAGSFLSWYVLIPLISHFGSGLTTTLPPVTDGTLIANMGPHQLFGKYVRLIGIGGIACAGIIGIIKSSKIIFAALTVGFKEIFGGKKGKELEEGVQRTQKDIKMEFVFVAIALVLIGVFAFFLFNVLGGITGAVKLAVIGLLIVLVVSFLFTSVAIRAIAVVGTNPVSGMTLMTLIISSLILVKSGLSGNEGIVAALIIGGVVCTALSMAGGFITDLKIGYWIGSTPFQQERFKFLGTLVSAVTVAAVIILLNKTYGFVPSAIHPAKDVLVAPQANAMAAVIGTLMNMQQVPWILYGVGVLIAIICEMSGIPPLVFALGMYIPLELNTPILVGGFLAYLVNKSSKDKKLAQARHDKGTLIASGLIAGGAIIGVISALLKYFNLEDKMQFIKVPEFNMNLIGIIVFTALCVIFYFWAKSAKESDE
ncbi:MAG: oligopeptide transporter, OPT family [Armatimonadota bacterium]